jgi:hypothetical protein
MYNAPMLAVLHNLKIPRVCVVTDPRCYPRDQEMSYGWPWCRPRAVLGQWGKSFKKRVGGMDYNITDVYAYPESWARLPAVRRDREVLCTSVSHAHVETGIGQASWEPWRVIHADGRRISGFKQYGEGWEHCPWYDPELMPGLCDDARETLAGARYCPVVAHTPGYATGKPYVISASGCVPLFYGDGAVGTYGERLLPPDHPWRIRNEGDMLRLCETSDWSEMRSYWQSTLVPEWKVLDDLLDSETLEGFGGYERV